MARRLPIFDVPGVTGANSASFTPQSFSVASRSPVTADASTADDQMIDRWMVKVTYPDLQFQAVWGPLAALLVKAQPGRGLLRVVDPARRYPLGRAAGLCQAQPVAPSQLFSDGTGFSDGSGFADLSAFGALRLTALARQDFVHLTGLVASQAISLHIFDAIQIGDDYHIAMETVPSSEAGRATVAIWPRLRRTHPLGTPVRFVDAGVICRMTQPLQGIALRPPSQMTISLDLIEEVLP
jgi:hypothetical protein